jgi:O-antigen/teichoic acid export membrane protein
MENVKKSFFLNSLFLTISSILEKIFFFIINIIIAHYLSREQFGEYSAALAFGTFFSVFSSMGVGNSSVRAINYYKNEINEVYTNTIILKTILSILTFSVLLGAIFITGFNKNTIILTLILSLVRITNEFLSTLNQIFEAKSKFILSSIYTSLFALLFLGGTYAVIIFKGDYFDLSYTRLAIITVITAAAFIHTLRFYKLKFDFKKLKKFTLETIPFSYSVIASSVTSNFSAIILPVMHGTIYSGIFNNAYIFFLSLLFIPGNLSRVLMPYLFQHKYSEDKGLFRYAFDTYGKIFSIMSFYLTIIFFMYCGPMITLVFGTKYGDSIGLLQLFAFAIPFAFNVSPNIISSLNKQIINSRIDITASVISIASSLILIKYFKAEGAVLSIVIVSVISYVLSNGYLIKNKYISYTKTARIRFTLLLISLVCYGVKISLEGYRMHVMSMTVVTVIYFALVWFLVVDKDDTRLIRNIVS